MMAAAAAGIDQPATTAAKIKTASHTKFLTVPGAPQLISEVEILAGARRRADERVDFELELFSELIRNEIFERTSHHLQQCNPRARLAREIPARFLACRNSCDLERRVGLQESHRLVADFSFHSGLPDSHGLLSSSGLLSAPGLSVRLDLSIHSDFSVHSRTSQFARTSWFFTFFFLCAK
jgi:hypothetical protein